MIDGKSVLAIIPARGGSKGLPNKNIKQLLDKPLIAWTIEHALKTKYLDCIFVSTDDDELANIGRKYGLEVIERPKELAKDETPIIDVLFHFVEIQELGINGKEIILVLQPTSPIRNAEDIENAIEVFSDNDCESVVSVCESTHPPYWSFKIEETYLQPLFEKKYLSIRRQDLKRTYIPNGAIYILTPTVLHKYENLYCNKTLPYVMPIERSIDIDNEIDFMLAELLVKKYETAKK